MCGCSTRGGDVGLLLLLNEDEGGGGGGVDLILRDVTDGAIAGMGCDRAGDNG